MLGQDNPPLVARDEKCGFEGNSDLYGLGIRLGIYMQWLSAFPAMTSSRPHGIGPLADTYLIFIFAIFVAILVLTAEKRPTHAAEMSVLTYIIFGGSYTILWTNVLRRKVTTMDGEAVAWFLRRFLVCCLMNAIGCYWFWFWLRGVHDDNFPATPCGSYVFLFAKVPLYNRHVTNIFTALSAILIYGMSNQIRWLWKDLREYLHRNRAPVNQEVCSDPLDEALRRHKAEREAMREKLYKIISGFFGKIAPFYRAASFVYCALGIELTLYWNGVTDVYSVRTTGQLIPLTIGACGLAQFLYAPAVDWVVKKAEERERRQQEDTEAGGVATA
ncbi:hypothetical protein CEP51_015383 [Fusarium floridanum]|uniref:Uncharacterized protein n=1 Tax=Fusarium floridanum TaxID=1325733 RepID=A0A428PAW8_9HYPO|nr:hypothetical protein CEP51_015383 [Fusarium floridanum]